MFLWISGFLKNDSEDDSLKFNLTVDSNLENAVMGILGWRNFEEAADGEWLLTDHQIQQISAVMNETLPLELDIFIGVRE